MRTLLDEGEIFNIAVCRNARQLGIGGALLQAAIHHAEAENVENIFLEVRASNGPCILPCTKKYGFEPVGLRKKYYDNPTEDARIMVRRSKQEEKQNMLILSIESSCDETAAAVTRNGREVLSNEVFSQADMHALYGGVVPEIASRNHITVISRLALRAPWTRREFPNRIWTLLP